jgi:hypothetical protein
MHVAVASETDFNPREMLNYVIVDFQAPPSARKSV